MKDLLYAIAAGLVEDKTAIKIIEDEPDAEGVIVFHLSVAPDDMGRVIGKQGRIAKALRTIMRAGAAKKDLKVSVTIEQQREQRDAASNHEVITHKRYQNTSLVVYLK